MLSTKSLQATDELRRSVEDGITARRTAKGKKDASEGKLARKFLQASSQRLLGLLDVLEMAQGKAAPALRASSSDLSSPPESMDEDLGDVTESE
jgi:hypothetical protein